MKFIRRFFEGVWASIVTTLFIIIFLWLEFAGIYHAFAHHGVRDGFISVFVPPYSWYRSVDFIFWIARRGDRLTTKEWEAIEIVTQDFLLEQKLPVIFEVSTDKDFPMFTFKNAVELDNDEYIRVMGNCIRIMGQTVRDLPPCKPGIMYLWRDGELFAYIKAKDCLELIQFKDKSEATDFLEKKLHILEAPD